MCELILKDLLEGPMARETKRMALYEVIRKGQTKRAGGRKTIGMRPIGSAPSRFAKKKDCSLSQRYDSPGSKEPVGQTLDSFFTRKLELSMSYLAAAMLVIAQLVVVAGAVRFGQVYHDKTLPFLASKPVVEDVLIKS